MATDNALRKERLHRLLDLARATRGWSRARLGRELGRDPTKVYPTNGNPKTDFVVGLAGVLGWSVSDVVAAIWDGAGEPARAGGSHDQPGDDASYRERYASARAAHQRGDYQTVVEDARAMHRLAGSGERRAFACAMEYSGWDGLGRYVQGVEAARGGLAETEVGVTTRNILRADLANAWYSLWDLTPALGTAEVLADWYEKNPPEREVDRKRPAFVHYVRGNTRRRLMAVEPELAATHARAGAADLERSAAIYRELAGTLGDPSLGGIARTCDGGLIEIAVATDEISPAEGVRRLIDGADAGVADSEPIVGDVLESSGWWCIFGCNVALRHLEGRALQGSVRDLTTRALEIAERLDNWSMRERALALQFTLHQRLAERSGLELELTIDEYQRGLITATMGRFPAFRSTGWTMLETARVVRG